ncbi:hypothetical protein GJAV_G00249790 [Gymnothorax javanicus]|nr:hypothetical protein GJAV_G00249790 [Gymnothorax javanicus]
MRTAIFLLYTWWTAGLYISFVQSEALRCIVGDRVHFQEVVKKTAFVSKDDNEIAKVINSTLIITDDNYSGRLQWDRSSGIFTLSEVKLEDSGKYTVQNNDGSISGKTTFMLTVYDPVGRPQVRSENRVKPGCSVQCSVENGREVTLSWRREGQTLNYTSSPNLSSPLSLLLKIEENSAPYICMAANPARNRTVEVIPEKYCYDVVSKPHIESSKAAGGSSCLLKCSVENGMVVSLSWSIKGETLLHTSNPDLSALSLTLGIKLSNHTFTCEARNPVSVEKTVFHPSQMCGPQDYSTHDAVLYIMFVLRLVEFAFVTFAVTILINQYRIGSIPIPHRAERRRRRSSQSETVTEL